MINNKGKKLTLQNERNPTYSGTEELIAIEQGLKKYSKYIVHQIAKAGKGKLNIKSPQRNFKVLPSAQSSSESYHHRF